MHILAVRAERPLHVGEHARVRAHEPRRGAGVQPQHVVRHEHLPGAVRARADADGGDSQQRSDERGQLRGDLYKDDAARPRGLHRKGIRHDGPRRLCRAPLQGVPCNTRGRLWQQAHVAHDRDALGHDRSDLARLRHPALQFYRLRAALLHQPHRVVHRRVHRRERSKGEVRHDERARRAPRHGCGRRHHVPHRHLHRGLVAQYHHAQAVANENDVRAVIHSLRDS